MKKILFISIGIIMVIGAIWACTNYKYDEIHTKSMGYCECYDDGDIDLDDLLRSPPWPPETGLQPCTKCRPVCKCYPNSCGCNDEDDDD